MESYDDSKWQKEKAVEAREKEIRGESYKQNEIKKEKLNEKLAKRKATDEYKTFLKTQMDK